MKVLVTGGAGYIGSHAARLLAQHGHTVVVYDNLSKGHQAAVVPGALVQGDLSNQSLLTQLLTEKEIDAVFHFAGLSEVAQSLREPASYYRNNVAGTLNLLNAMRASNVSRIVFSSTAAIYGETEQTPVNESASAQPTNPYGFTKWVAEQAISDFVHAYGFSAVSLRYFNACGASLKGDIGEDHRPESHLIPLTLQAALGQRPQIHIFGDDFETPDGTGIRDYVHVNDIASAHLAALSKLGTPGMYEQYNLGIGHGFSVRQIVEACREVTGHQIPVAYADRRHGDVATLIADSTRAKEDLAWKPEFTGICEMIESAWRWHRRHPHGFSS